MSDINPLLIRAGYNLNNLNYNFDLIKNKVNNDLLHRSGGNNYMNQSLDMNFQRVINLPAPVGEHEPVRKGDVQEVLDAIATVSESAETAEEAAETATTAASQASASASAASSSESAAQGHSSSASASASTATTQAGIATNAASVAQNSSGLAQTAASTAIIQADIATARASDAEDSATAAGTSESNALASANTAITQASNALSSANSASNSEGNALTYRNQAESARDIAVDAAASVNNLLNGEGAPAGSLGDDGDYYIDNTSNEIYGPKTSGSWGTPTSLIGPEGPEGVLGLTLPTSSNNGYIVTWVGSDADEVSQIDPGTFATSAQGALAATAVQPGDLATVATTNSYLDLSNRPSLGTASAATVTTSTTDSNGARLPNVTWVNAKAFDVKSVSKNSSSTLLLTDSNKEAVVNSGSTVTLTIPTNASVAFPLWTKLSVLGIGTGAVNISAASGVTLNGVSGGSFTISNQFSGVVITKVSTNGWVICGDYF